MSFILELRRRAAPSSDARFCCLPLSSAMSTIALARAPSSALALSPSLASPSPSHPRRPRLCPPRPLPAIAAVDDDHHCRCRTFDNDDRQKPAVVVRHRRLLAVIVECGGGRWLRRQWRLCHRCQRQRSAPSAPSHHRLRQQRP